MSKNLHPDSSAWNIISEVHPLLRSLIDALRENKIPNNECMAKIQNLLSSYISELEQSKTLARKFGVFSFQDSPQQDASDNVIIEEMSKKPDAIQILYTATIKKLISVEADNLPQDLVEWMVLNHYLAPVTSSLHNSDKLYSITSKGYSCLTKKKIRSRLCKNLPSDTIPKALRIAPEDWNFLTLFQASIIERYYEQKGVKDYMIIPARGQENVLLGCEISADPNIRYVFVWIDAPTVQTDWKSCLQETISAQSVSNITIVCQKKAEIRTLQDTVQDLKNADKIQISCVEVSE